MRDDSDTPTGIASGPLRRDVMKALGIGTALGAVGGAIAQEGDEETDDGTGQAGDDGRVAGDNTVHTVRTIIGPSTNPDRPADFYYQPTGLHIQPGDVVRWVFQTPDHTVTSYHPAFGMQRRLPDEVEPFSSPIMGWDPASLPADIDEPPAEGPGDGGAGGEMDGEQFEPRPSTWLRAFDTPGVYDMECAPHETFGMAMRIVVGDRTDTTFETSDPSALPEPRAGPVGLARVILTDPNLEPDVIRERGRVEWQALDANQGDGNGTPAGTETATETDAEPETETGTDAATEAGTETETATQTESGTETEPATQTESGTETETATQTESGDT